jgi:hypothetical protein
MATIGKSLLLIGPVIEECVRRRKRDPPFRITDEKLTRFDFAKTASRQEAL